MEEIMERPATTESFDQLIEFSETNKNEKIELLKETYLAPIINQEKYSNIQIDYKQTKDYLEAIFTDPINRHYIVVEINRTDSPDEVVENFTRGHKVAVETFATEVYEMKWENHE